jgi:hypothetical protein
VLDAVVSIWTWYVSWWLIPAIPVVFVIACCVVAWRDRRSN